MTLRELLKHKVDLYNKHIRQLDTGGFDSLTVGDAITLAKELRLTAAEANNYFCPNYVPAETEANIE
jgi:hypothetical protein